MLQKNQDIAANPLPKIKFDAHKFLMRLRLPGCASILIFSSRLASDQQKISRTVLKISAFVYKFTANYLDFSIFNSGLTGLGGL